jgi:putative transposase
VIIKGEERMVKKHFTAEQIIGILREADVKLSQGLNVGQVSRELGITEQTYYRWRKEYGGMKTAQAKRLKDLERENGRLKKAVAELTLDKLILKEALEGNY